MGAAGVDALSAHVTEGMLAGIAGVSQEVDLAGFAFVRDKAVRLFSRVSAASVQASRKDRICL
ncbi:hypothetical protein APT63_03055 [Pseudomonas sp. 22-AL-CL-001]|nr:hypothetical protein APT63_03055 [Pseudomonas monteilii]